MAADVVSLIDPVFRIAIFFMYLTPLPPAVSPKQPASVDEPATTAAT